MTRNRSLSDGLSTTLRIDLFIARASLAIIVTGYVANAIAPQPALFMLSAAMDCLGSGLAPTMQSAVLELYRRSGGTEIGKLLGALSVMEVIGYVFIACILIHIAEWICIVCRGQVVGTPIFGSLYTSTVASFPQAIFVLSAVTFGLTIFVILPVRIRPLALDLYTDEGDWSFQLFRCNSTNCNDIM